MRDREMFIIISSTGCITVIKRNADPFIRLLNERRDFREIEVFECRSSARTSRLYKFIKKRSLGDLFPASPTTTSVGTNQIRKIQREEEEEEKPHSRITWLLPLYRTTGKTACLFSGRLFLFLALLAWEGRSRPFYLYYFIIIFVILFFEKGISAYEDDSLVKSTTVYIRIIPFTLLPLDCIFKAYPFSI